MKAHESVMEWVTEELSSGRLRIGDRLPSERALSETLGVSRASLREAFRVLEALGTLRSSTGSGPSAGTVLTAAPEQALSLALNLQLVTSQVTYRDISEMRVLLETWAAAHSRVEQGAWGEAEHLLELMDDPSLPVDLFLNYDVQFHVLLSRAADNPLVSTMMESLSLSISERAGALARALPDWGTTAVGLRDEHHQILSALRAGDTASGAALLRAHIEGYAQQTESLSA